MTLNFTISQTQKLESQIIETFGSQLQEDVENELLHLTVLAVKKSKYLSLKK